MQRGGFQATGSMHIAKECIHSCKQKIILLHVKGPVCVPLKNDIKLNLHMIVLLTNFYTKLNLMLILFLMSNLTIVCLILR